MLGRILDTKTSDGILLHGFLAIPDAPSDALWLIVHGVNGNFYSSTLLQLLAETALEQECAALRINTRGHDLASFGSSDLPARLGSMFEAIEDSTYDLSSWIECARREGFSRIGVMAHSLGAVKVGYCLANGLQGIDRWVALSPPRLNTQLLLNDRDKCQVFQQHLEQARHWCEEGKGNHIMRVRFPLPNWVSAATFLDKYGSDDKYDYLSWWDRIRIPTLWAFGELEVRRGSANFFNADQHLRERIHTRISSQSSLDDPTSNGPKHEVDVIDSADHSYRSTRDALRQRLSDWIAKG